MPSESREAPARRFGRYELLDLLGAGGMAEVYRARLEGAGGFHKTVALKVFHEHLSDDPVFSPTFINEARLGGFLDHPNIIATLDFGRHRGRLFMAMEYVKGLTLQRILVMHRKAHRQLPPDVALGLSLQLCRGLEYAHGARDHAGNPLHLIHRDLKPSNLIVDLLGTAKIADFGVARAESNVERTLVPGTLKGTIRYMSPEQARGGSHLDHRSDIFALGLVTFECLTLHPCYDAKTLEEVLLQAQEADVAPRLQRVPEMPQRDAVVAVLARALRRDPRERYPSCGEMATHIERILARMPSKTDIGVWVRTLFTTGTNGVSENGRRARFEAATRLLIQERIHSQETRVADVPWSGNGPPDALIPRDPRRPELPEDMQPTRVVPPNPDARNGPSSNGRQATAVTQIDKTRVSSRSAAPPGDAGETVAGPDVPAFAQETRVSRPWEGLEHGDGGTSPSAPADHALTPTALQQAARGGPLGRETTRPLTRNAPRRRNDPGRGKRPAGKQPVRHVGHPGSSRIGPPLTAARGPSRDRRFRKSLPLLPVLLIAGVLGFWSWSGPHRPGAPMRPEPTHRTPSTMPSQALTPARPEDRRLSPASQAPMRPQPASMKPRTPKPDRAGPVEDARAGGHRRAQVSEASGHSAPSGNDEIAPPSPPASPTPPAFEPNAPNPGDERTRGRLFLFARPPAAISVDTLRLDTFPVQDYPVGPGRHTLSFVWPDGTRLDHEVTIDAGTTLRCVANKAPEQVRCRVF